MEARAVGRTASSSVYVPIRFVCRNGDGSRQRVVVVRLGGEVHDGVVVGDEGSTSARVADVALDERERSAGSPSSDALLPA